jgi:hypothetical protein
MFVGSGIRDELDLDPSEAPVPQPTGRDDLEDLWALVCGSMDLGCR